MQERRTMQRREGDDLKNLEEKIVDLQQMFMASIEKHTSMLAASNAINDKTNELIQRRLDIAEASLKRIDDYIRTKESYLNGGWDVIKKGFFFIGIAIAAIWAVFSKFYK